MKGTSGYADRAHQRGHMYTDPCTRKMPRVLVCMARVQRAQGRLARAGALCSLPLRGSLSQPQLQAHAPRVHVGSGSVPPGPCSVGGLTPRLLCPPCPGAHPERHAGRRGGRGHRRRDDAHALRLAHCRLHLRHRLHPGLCVPDGEAPSPRLRAGESWVSLLGASRILASPHPSLSSTHLPSPAIPGVPPTDPGHVWHP